MVDAGRSCQWCSNQRPTASTMLESGAVSTAEGTAVAFLQSWPHSVPVVGDVDAFHRRRRELVVAATVARRVSWPDQKQASGIGRWNTTLPVQHRTRGLAGPS